MMKESCESGESLERVATAELGGSLSDEVSVVCVVGD